MAPYEAKVVADYFVSRSIPGTNQNITNLKLQKILYFAQGFYYTLYKKRLFNEEIVAETHGPVVKEVYYFYRSFNYREITLKEINSSNLLLLQKEDRIFLDSIWEIFKDFNGKQLEYLTQQEIPWRSKQESNLNSSPSNRIISPLEISDYLLKNYVRNKTGEVQLI